MYEVVATGRACVLLLCYHLSLSLNDYLSPRIYFAEKTLRVKRKEGGEWPAPPMASRSSTMPGSRRNVMLAASVGTRAPARGLALRGIHPSPRRVHTAAEGTLPSRSPAPAAWVPARLSKSKDESNK